MLLLYLYKKLSMKLSHKIALGICIITAAGIALHLTKRSRTNRMLTQISDEGYETANDILFPGKQLDRKTLHYGPVIPLY